MSTSIISSQRQLTQAVGVSLFLVVLSSHVRPVRNIIRAWIGRCYFNYFVRAGKAVKECNDSAIITGLFIHPVKSLKAVPLQSAVLGAKGLVGDRKYMLVTPAPLPPWGSFGPNEPTHRFLTQRQSPLLTQVSVLWNEKNGTLEFSSKLSIPEPNKVISSTPSSASPIYRTTLWDDTVLVQDMGDEIAMYFNSIIQLDKELPEEYKNLGVRLVVQCDQDNRSADDKYVPGSARSLLTGSGPPVALTDGFPILVASEESLGELNKRLKSKGKDPLPMSRFRPNIVLQGLGTPFAEDRIKVLQIGKDGALLHLVKGCPRCKESCTDQDTGEVTDEPCSIFREFRVMNSSKPTDFYFAQNAIVAIGSEGKVISVGDEVKVLKCGEPVWED